MTLVGALGLIGGTMGLFTGFSILSGIEILYFLAMDYRQGTSSEYQVANKVGLQEDPGSCGPGLGQAEKGA